MGFITINSSKSKQRMELERGWKVETNGEDVP